jgi:hypothetical protein
MSHPISPRDRYSNNQLKPSVVTKLDIKTLTLNTIAFFDGYVKRDADRVVVVVVERGLRGKEWRGGGGP